MKFLFPEVGPYLYKSTRQLKRNTVVMPGLVLVAATWICQIRFSASLEPLPYGRNVPSLSLSYRYYFGRFLSELAKLVPFPYFRGRSTRSCNRIHDLSVTIPRCSKGVYVNNLVPRTTRLGNSLPAKCFPLTDNLNGFVLIIKCLGGRFGINGRSAFLKILNLPE